MNPPNNAIVLCVGEKSQIQALDRTILPMRPGLAEKATHDYQRNGTATLFAHLEIATGKVSDRWYDRHSKAEFLGFLKAVARLPATDAEYDGDNYHTHTARRHRRLADQEHPCDTAFHPNNRVVG